MFGLIFINGDLNDGPVVRQALNAAGLVIAVDGGLRHTRSLSMRPHIVIGDMDSADPAWVAEAEAQGAEIRRYPAHKDETDFELALLYAVERGCDSIRVIGAVGDRLDQSLANVYLLALPALRGRDIRLLSGAQSTWIAYPGVTAIDGAPGDTVSLVPLSGDARGIVTEALEYPLRGETLHFGPARGISNVMLSTRAQVTFESGLLLVIHTLGRA